MESLLTLLSIRGIGSIRARHLIEAFGSAQAVLEAPKDQLLQLGNIGQMILDGIADPMSSKRIEEELAFIEKNHIRPLIYGEEGYPKRLLDCADAPALLFQLGDTPLDETHIVSIVGTRSCTQYGRELVHRFVSELHEAFPNVIIVSGLALGIDVESHQAALNCGARTVGVVAHGLDRIYPSQHRSVAKEMLLNHGSLITEYMTGTEPERCNYLIFNNFSFLSTSFFCKIPSLFIIKIIGQFGHIKNRLLIFAKIFNSFHFFPKMCPFGAHLHFP